MFFWFENLKNQLYCQAQFQSNQFNPNWLDWDSLITDNYYPHPIPNLGIVRKKGPSGLKFCMRPQLTILTTNQHNFNPTNFWGGGICWLIVPDLSYSSFKKFWPKKISIRKIFDPKIFHSKILYTQKILIPNIFWPKFFRLKKTGKSQWFSD